MYPVRLIILLLFISSGVNAQQTRKILIIDTVQNMGQRPISPLAPGDTSYSSGMIEIDTVASNSSSYYVIRHKYTLNRLSSNLRSGFPNLIMPVMLGPEAADLELPLDDSGGIFTLKGAFLDPGDTLRISRITIYHNCLPDSLLIRVHWFWNFNDTNHTEPKHLYSKFRVKVKRKECRATYPDFGSITVNSKSYIFPIQTVSVIDAPMYYCNGRKRMSRRRGERYERSIMEGKPYKYFSGSERKVRSHLFAEVTIK